MAIPDQIAYRLLEVVDASGTPVTGLVTGSFTVKAYARGYGAAIFTAYAHSTAVQEIGGGIYDAAHLLPPSAGWFYYRIVPTNPSYRIVAQNIWSGECESVDLSRINSNVVVPVATVTSSAQLGMPLAIELIAYRKRTIAAVVKDQAGNNVDLTTYNNFALSIRSKDQTTTKWDATNGSPYGFAVSGDVNGNLSITFPESSSGPIYVSWSTLRADALGDFMVPSVSNGYVYRCTTAGVGAAGEPAWPVIIGTTVADGTAVWTCVARIIWKAATAQVVGDTIRPKTGVAGILAQYWRCTTPGTTAAGEPTWPASPAAGATLTDGSAVWTYQSDFYAALVSAGASGVNSLGLYLELTADELATDKTVPVIRSSALTLSRREVGT